MHKQTEALAVLAETANVVILLTAMQINARSADNGLTVDMSQMRGVVVDPVQQTAVVQGPALLSCLDLALPLSVHTQSSLVPFSPICLPQKPNAPLWQQLCGLSCSLCSERHHVGFAACSRVGVLASA